jgi:hypothetical protein
MECYAVALIIVLGVISMVYSSIRGEREGDTSTANDPALGIQRRTVLRGGRWLWAESQEDAMLARIKEAEEETERMKMMAMAGFMGWFDGR